ncbi:hypothetical protein KNO15_11320 [Leifsonia shinshuensis]|uniref:hypothetical protein n=1 Tax=Leifsonia shinshuensis TaxID=150026 RepID=UPI001F515402|nr:hypothetical protein [Leifsonia shinshuensis]MCI0157285.1 hypothetical protein [Leifsonia shinshuensis]
MNDIQPTSRRRGSGGPPLGVLAIVHAGLFLLALLVGVLLSGPGAAFLSPFAGADAVTAHAHADWAAIRIGAMLQFGSAVPLGIYAATAFARLQRLGVRVPGPAIGFAGGLTASIMLMVSALGSYLLSRPELTSDPHLALAFSYLAFAAGGVGYVVGLGLLIAGIAVPGLILRLFPRWLAWVGLVVAALSELSFLSLAVDPLQFLLPIGRFAGMAWLIAAGFLLPVDRREVRDARGARAEVRS